MLTIAGVSQLIDGIYAAGETGEGWGQCLGTICESLEGTGGHLLHYDLSARSGVVVVDARTDQAAVQAYDAHFHRVDPWAASLPTGGLAVGRIVPGHAVLSHADMQKTEYYADLGRAFGLTRSIFGFTGHHADGSRSAIAINRADNQAEFDDDAVAFLTTLMPHLGRALQMRAHWPAVGQRHQAALDALDGLPYVVLLVNGEARVCFANARASALLAHRNGLATDDGRLRGATPAVTRRLRDLCAEVAATRSSVPRHPGATLNLPRAGATMPLHALIAPVPTHGAFSVPGHDVAAVVYVSDPAETAIPDEALLRASYGLTPAESRVAALVAAGCSVEEIAEQLQYTSDTTRWYVKQVLSKTGCRTRGEFTARAARSIAMLRAR